MTIKFRLTTYLITGFLLASSAEAGLSGYLTKIFEKDKVLWLLFVDGSKSRLKQDWEIYQTTFEGILKSLNPDDRIIIGRVGENSITTFFTEADVILQNTGVDFDDSEFNKKHTDKLKDVFENLKDKLPAGMSKLFGILDIAEDIFQKDSERKTKYIVILSDMIHEDGELNFRKVKLTAQQSEKIIEDKKNRGLLPNLKGIKIFVSGAGGNISDSKYYEIRDFWLRYFRETGAICDPSMYGRTATVKFK